MIMANQPYFPSSEAERIVWLSHFRTKLPLHTTTLGLAATEVTATVADIDFYVWLLQTWNPAVQNNALEATAYKVLIGSGSGSLLVALPTAAVFTQPPAVRLPGVLPRLFTMVQRIKLSTGYNEAIGQDLDIIGSQDNSTHPVPEFTAISERGNHSERTKISFTKYGHDGVSIEGRINNGAWSVLGIAVLKPWYDERELLVTDVAEIREYRLRWWDKGEAHSDYSPIQKVTVGP
jgi:hypothetical protein